MDMDFEDKLKNLYEEMIDKILKKEESYHKILSSCLDMLGPILDSVSMNVKSESKWLYPILVRIFYLSLEQTKEKYRMHIKTNNFDKMSSYNKFYENCLSKYNDACNLKTVKTKEDKSYLMEMKKYCDQIEIYIGYIVDFEKCHDTMQA